MSLIDDLILGVAESRGMVEKITTGTRWTLVASSQCGLACLAEEPQAEVGTSGQGLSGRPLRDLFPLASSADGREASLGVAALNAALAESLKPSRFQPRSIPRARGKTVGLVGDFAFAEQLKDLAREVILISGDHEEDTLAGVDIAIIGGHTIVDQSMERLLRASASCYTVVYGPSTPLSPVLFDYGADQLVGVKVEDRDKTKRCISEGLVNLMECPGLRPIVLRSNPQEGSQEGSSLRLT